MTYEPQEDSFLLQKYVKKLAKGSVLDMCTGSGIQALTAAKKKSVASVTASDIFRTPGFSHAKIKYVQSNLFRRIPKFRFDTIVCNPPYLPQEGKKRVMEMEGGMKGYEFIEEFFVNAGGYLKPGGNIFLVFSSMTGRTVVENLIRENAFDFELLEEQSFFFEKLYCCRIFRPPWYSWLLKKRVKHVKHFMKGKRGRIFVGNFKGVRAAVKVRNEKSSVDTLENEARFLRLANSRGIGPEFLFARNDCVVYKFVSGRFFKDVTDALKKKAMPSLLKQARMMDKLGFSKGEMQRPLKNVIICRSRPVLIDFERSRFDSRPQNVTQLCSFVRNSFANKKLSELCQQYKKNYSDAAFCRILAGLSSGAVGVGK